jgi:hypothetical protein
MASVFGGSCILLNAPERITCRTRALLVARRYTLTFCTAAQRKDSNRLQSKLSRKKERTLRVTAVTEVGAGPCDTEVECIDPTVT